MVSSFSSTCGCFVRVERSSSQTISLLFALSSLWIASRANGSASTYLGFKYLHVQEKVGGGTDPGVGQASRLRPTGLGPFRPDSVAPSLPRVLLYLFTSPLHLHHFDDVILASKMEVLLHEVRSFTLQSSGMFLCNTSVLATFGSDFIKLLNTNETPKLLL
jgi:hypothetical protein